MSRREPAAPLKDLTMNGTPMTAEQKAQQTRVLEEIAKEADERRNADQYTLPPPRPRQHNEEAIEPGPPDKNF